MSDFKPSYRGTLKALTAEKEDFVSFFCAVVRECVAGMDTADRALVEDLLGRSPDVHHVTIGVFSHDVTRDWVGGGLYAVRRKEEVRSDYYHVVNLGCKPKGAYGGAKIVLRKDGTFNRKTITAALTEFVRREKLSRTKRHVSRINRGLLDTVNMPDDKHISVTLSQTVPGACLVKYTSATCTFVQHDVDILQAANAAMHAINAASNFDALSPEYVLVDEEVLK